MKTVNVIFGAIVVLLGLLPLLEDYGALPNILEVIPREGLVYNIIIVVIGILIIIYSSKERRFRLR